MCGVQLMTPHNYTGPVLVLLPAFPLVSPLQYEVVTRSLVVQSLGLSICAATAGNR